MSNTFNPNAPGLENANIYGFPTQSESADLVIIPVPWDVTVSFGKGTSLGPEAIFNASKQTDVFDPLVTEPWKLNVAMENISLKIIEANNKIRPVAEDYIAVLVSGEEVEEDDVTKLEEVNKASEWLNNFVYKKAKQYLAENKIPIVLGGEHSCSFGLIKALAEKYPNFGILQIDAHADLRDSYEGFKFSHASAAYNAAKIPSVVKIVQLGIRDYCDEENTFIKESNGRIVSFFDADIAAKQFKGISWDSICKDIINALPDNIYITFDIDGLDPSLCPSTGTPVPGGLSYNQAVYLLEQLVLAGKKIISFDLCEVAPGENEWDSIVAAKLLFRLINLTAVSHGYLKLSHTNRK